MTPSIDFSRVSLFKNRQISTSLKKQWKANKSPRIYSFSTLIRVLLASVGDGTIFIQIDRNNLLHCNSLFFQVNNLYEVLISKMATESH